MKDEIKEILSLLKSSSWCNEANQIEDYITNLQEDNAELRNEVNELNKICDLYGKSLYNAELTDYKSRNEKANNILKDTNVDMPETLLIETIDYARHILNGGDDNE